MKKTTTITIDETVLSSAKLMFPGMISSLCETALRLELERRSSREFLQDRKENLLRQKDSLEQEITEHRIAMQNVNKELQDLEAAIQKIQKEEQKTNWKRTFENIATLYGINELAYQEYLKLIEGAKKQGLEIPKEFANLDAPSFFELLRSLISS